MALLVTVPTQTLLSGHDRIKSLKNRLMYVASVLPHTCKTHTVSEDAQKIQLVDPECSSLSKIYTHTQKRGKRKHTEEESETCVDTLFSRAESRDVVRQRAFWLTAEWTKREKLHKKEAYQAYLQGEDRTETLVLQ